MEEAKRNGRPTAEERRKLRHEARTARAANPIPPADRKVLRVLEGPRQPVGAVDKAAVRTFSVVLNHVPAGDDLHLVAEAVDPITGVAIPAAGSEYPGGKLPGLVARPAFLMAVGFRDPGGAILATRSRFWNVRVSYIQTPSLATGISRPPAAGPGDK